MFWYKTWLDTRWRFLIGLALLMCSAGAVVFMYPKVQQLMPLVPNVDVSGELGRRIKEAAELSSSYRGYAWSQWFQQNLVQMWTLFAVLLGSGSLFSQASGGGTLFTLSLPVSRNHLLGVRTAAGLGELLVLAVVPSLLIPALAPVVGQTYGVGEALLHSVCLFVGGAVFFSLAILLSTIFSDVWRPLLVALSVAVALALSEQVFRELSPYGIFGVMTGETYFRTGSLPWPGLFASAAVSSALMYVAAFNVAHRDF